MQGQTYFFCIVRFLFQFKDCANLNFGLFLNLMLGGSSTVVTWKTPGFYVHVALLLKVRIQLAIT